MIRCDSEGDSKVWMEESFIIFPEVTYNLFFIRGKEKPMSEKAQMVGKKVSTTRRVALIAIMGALAFVLMSIEFPLPFIAPPYYKFDLSEVAVLIGGFSLGSLAAVCMEALKIVLHLLFKGTSTAFVGEIANFLMGLAFVLPATLIYKNHKTKKNAWIGLCIGTLTMALIAVFANYFLLLPAYAYFFHMSIESIVKAGHAIIPLIHNPLGFVLFSVLPFNLLKGSIVSICTLLLYKSISPLLHR